MKIVRLQHEIMLGNQSIVHYHKLYCSSLSRLQCFKSIRTRGKIVCTRYQCLDLIFGDFFLKDYHEKITRGTRSGSGKAEDWYECPCSYMASRRQCDWSFVVNTYQQSNKLNQNISTKQSFFGKLSIFATFGTQLAMGSNILKIK